MVQSKGASGPKTPASAMEDPLKPKKQISGAEKYTSPKSRISNPGRAVDNLSNNMGSTGFGTNYDMDDMQSSASFNSRMFDQFKDMDSISQFG